MRTYGSSCERVLTRARTEGLAFLPNAPRARAASPATIRILVSQCPSQRRLNRFCIGRQVNQGISGDAPDGDLFMPKQFNQQRNGRRTDPPDDVKRLQLQVFIVDGRGVVSAKAANARPPRTRAACGDCPDLRVAGHQAIFPVLSGALGKIRTLGLARLRE